METAAAASAGQQLFMPVLAFAAVGVLALVLRWSQTPGSRRTRLPSPRGLLVPVARHASRATAADQAGRLRRAGIRATTSPATARGVDVLVWQEQYGEARLAVRDTDDGAAPS